MFVERASNVSRIDRDFAINDQIERMESDIRESMNLFMQLDVERQGRVPCGQLLEFMTYERVIAHFATLEIDVTDRKRLKNMFDVDKDGFVSLEEFIVGCVR